MDQTECETAAGCMVAAGELVREYRDELLGRVGVVFARREAWWWRRHQARARWFHHRARLRRERFCPSERGKP